VTVETVRAGHRLVLTGAAVVTNVLSPSKRKERAVRRFVVTVDRRVVVPIVVAGAVCRAAGRRADGPVAQKGAVVVTGRDGGCAIGRRARCTSCVSSNRSRADVGANVGRRATVRADHRALRTGAAGTPRRSRGTAPYPALFLRES
jgi:hypothetical protein